MGLTVRFRSLFCGYCTGVRAFAECCILLSQFVPLGSSADERARQQFRLTKLLRQCQAYLDHLPVSLFKFADLDLGTGLGLGNLRYSRDKARNDTYA